ncbi:MAG TPA: hypothetical protein VGD36_00270 [Xanthobacteraceae bacterium]
MRLFLGMILGVVLTLGVAYVHDSTLLTASAGIPVERPMVNWDVVRDNVNTLVARAREQWTRLTAPSEPK